MIAISSSEFFPYTLTLPSLLCEVVNVTFIEDMSKLYGGGNKRVSKGGYDLTISEYNIGNLTISQNYFENLTVSQN